MLAWAIDMSVHVFNWLNIGGINDYKYLSRASANAKDKTHISL